MFEFDSGEKNAFLVTVKPEDTQFLLEFLKQLDGAGWEAVDPELSVAQEIAHFDREFTIGEIVEYLEKNRPVEKGKRTQSTRFINLLYHSSHLIIEAENSRYIKDAILHPVVVKAALESSSYRIFRNGLDASDLGLRVPDGFNEGAFQQLKAVLTAMSTRL